MSAASAWEIATKVRLGKMAPIPGLTGGSFAQNVRALGFRLTSITTDDAQIAGELPVPHRDPFDRMLLAQAQRLGARVTNERPLFASFGLPVMLIWSERRSEPEPRSGVGMRDRLDARHHLHPTVHRAFERDRQTEP